MTGKQHVAVLMGGWSPEREVSLVSGAKCTEALRELGYRVSEIDVDHTLDRQLATLQPDVCFNALHGVGGEDGEVQGLLEVLEIPYTHSGVRASALAMDKHLSKQIFTAHGLPVAVSVLIEKGQCSDHPLPLPYVLKPFNQGSSVGVEIIPEGTNHLPHSLTRAGWQFCDKADKTDKAMAEAYVAGSELTCGVLMGQVLDVMEIVPANGFYDYRAKYELGGSDHIVPAHIDAALASRIQHISETAHYALGCRSVTRSDFRFDEVKNELVLLEINTQPGMTPVSLVPEMAAARGISYTQLVQMILEDASCQR